MAFKEIVPYERFRAEVTKAIEDNRLKKVDDEDIADTPTKYIIRVGEQANAFKVKKFGKRYSGTDAFWTEWIKDIELELDQYWGTVRFLKQERIKDLTKGGADIEHAFAVHYRLQAEFEHKEFADNIDRYLFGELAEKRFDDFVFEKIDVVHPVELNAFKVSLRPAENLWPLTVRDSVDRSLVVDGKPNIFGALHWRNDLTELHGRDDEVEEIIQWARDKDTHKVKVLLISGPGGAGKSRLAAKAVADLINDHGWAGGFPLRNSVGNEVLLNGVGKGVALIIDYPEEDQDRVEKILTASSSDAQYERPVRIILTSRENKEVWKKRVPEERLPRFEEIPLGVDPYLNVLDAVKLARDAIQRFSSSIDCLSPNISEIKMWFESNSSHRLPLNVLAASIHAVLDPKLAFTLGNEDVLLALAELEIRRLRSYSLRDFKDKKALEKIVGLSIFLTPGMYIKTLQLLGGAEICDGKKGTGVLDSIRETPFWQRSQNLTRAHVPRPEPDLFATAFFLRVFFLQDEYPELPRWLAIVVGQSGGTFVDILGRVLLDLTFFEGNYSEKLNNATLAMIEYDPEIAVFFSHIPFLKYSPLNSEFVAKICEHLLLSETEIADRVSVQSALADIYSILGRHQEASLHHDSAIEGLLGISGSENPSFLHQFASLLNGKAIALSRQKKHEDALEVINHALTIHEKIQKLDLVLLAARGTLFDNQAGCLSDLEQYREAFTSANSALAVWKRLTADYPDNTTFKSRLAYSYINLSSMLADLGNPQDAGNVLDHSIEILSDLSAEKPSVYLPDLARALANQSTMYSFGDFKAKEKALDTIKRAVSIYSNLRKSQPSIYNWQYVESLANQSLVQSDLRQYKEAIVSNDRAIQLGRTIIAETPEIYANRFSGILSNQAIVLSLTKKNIEALDLIDEAIEFGGKSHTKSWKLGLINNKSKILFEMGEYDLSLQNSEYFLLEFSDIEEERKEFYDKNRSQYYYYRAKCFQKLTKYDESCECFEHSFHYYQNWAQSDPGKIINMGHILFAKSALFFQQKKYLKSVTELTNCLRLISESFFGFSSNKFVQSIGNKLIRSPKYVKDAAVLPSSVLFKQIDREKNDNK